MTESAREPEVGRPPLTVPDPINFNIRGLEAAEARELADWISAYLREISRHINLEKLDGVTLASDYEQALLELDRGFETSRKLTPTKDKAFGVAMTPRVKRDGVVKSRIVLNLAVALPLMDYAGELFPLAFHTLAHECAHVEISGVFDKAFPNTLLEKRWTNVRDDFRWQIISACWDEYAATWISANFGGDPTSGYVETFVSHLHDAREKANSQIKAYRIHGDHGRIFGEVYGTYGDLMKFACYLLGTMFGKGLALDDLPELRTALEGHWFEKHFAKLQAICTDIGDEYGKWADTSKFERIGDLADEIVKEGGILVRVDDDGEVAFDAPFTKETMPF